MIVRETHMLKVAPKVSIAKKKMTMTQEWEEDKELGVNNNEA